jgi:hypothetical protein
VPLLQPFRTPLTMAALQRGVLLLSAQGALLQGLVVSERRGAVQILRELRAWIGFGEQRSWRAKSNDSATACSYSRWWNATRPYPVDYHKNYEPYIVAARQTLPRFDERFRSLADWSTWTRSAGVRATWYRPLSARGFSLVSQSATRFRLSWTPSPH